MQFLCYADCSRRTAAGRAGADATSSRQGLAAPAGHPPEAAKVASPLQPPDAIKTWVQELFQVSSKGGLVSPEISIAPASPGLKDLFYCHYVTLMSFDLDPGR